MADEASMFALAFRDSPIGMAILDEDGRYLEVNGTFLRIIGRTSRDLTGHYFGVHTHPDDLNRDVELMGQLSSGELPYFQVQKRFLHHSGDTVWTRVTVSNAQAPTGTARRFIAQVEDITEIRRAKDLLERRALYDHLTGLANRNLLIDRLTRALDGHEKRSTTVACIFLDIDHFKIVNDSLGHEAGDNLLIEIATRIRGCVRSGDTVARLGGDEFVVILDNVVSQAAAEGHLAVIAEAVQVPFKIEEHEVVPTVSAGLAMAEEGITAESLVRNADMATYTAKQGGRNRYEVFSSKLRNEALTRLSIEAELRTALREGELVVYYQPVVELATREIVAFEALVRWQHPTRGLVMPDEFIPICEEANLVVPLGAMVLHEACDFIARNPRFNGRVFVNVSTRQIGSADLTRVVKQALAASGIPARRLGLEITESGMLLATNAAHSDLAAITNLGVDLIIDDFGTGYSALSSVLQNPVSGLKLAREFTLRLGDRAIGDRISTTIATLTQSLNMYGVIEGVETEAQYRQARRHGWTYGQGYLFGRPSPVERIVFGADGSVNILPAPDATADTLAAQ